MSRTPLLSLAALAAVAALTLAPATDAAPQAAPTPAPSTTASSATDSSATVLSATGPTAQSVSAKAGGQARKSAFLPVPQASADSPVPPSAHLHSEDSLTPTEGTASVGLTTASRPTAPASAFTVSTAALTTTATATATTASTTTSPAVRTCPMRFGVGTPGGSGASSELAEVASLTGEKPAMILAYKDFKQPVPYWELEQARSAGATTLLTWEPWVWGGGLNQPAYSLDRIAAGDHDAYITDWAKRLASWGNPVMLRFGHEMNGNWYPWSEGVNGNGTGDYVAAWRHVHDIFTKAGASNVEWVWNPNVPYWGSTPLDGLYPGDAYVDTVALDGYNWGTSQSWSSWQHPWELFGWGLSEMRRIAPGKEIIVAETASAEAGGSKAKWNADLVYYLAREPGVTGLVWFHYNKETDWRINSTTTSATALANELAKRPCP
ncbi:glycoside hydrolase family 26 protein [Kocuria sp. KH4]